ncbi:uncharacterized protein Z518_09562 [Rhinocladiella mackenziei CBS 650.93]|uniref:DNA damage-binding protein CMR1 n=1 Tax=Rhinocladiella mackenziei CBS 650.93 TaxID=1442369 RepID=A0A0D2IYX5_9EURO|nr:uncharacterized protein Z518_09562 [Rhinocladiella mackenziei CBS 650.93]KIX01835.1 hypothetical protein Z518_09562 [Rhinocladiella mackenziei CBS 650.93]
MARGAQVVPVEHPDFEKQRLANIAERDALLKKLTQDAQQAGLYSKPATGAGTHKGQKRPAKRKEHPTKRVKQEEVLPRRTSSRLAGIQADSEVAKQKADEEYEKAKEAERQKRLRVTGDLNFADGSSLIGTDVILKGVAKPYERTFHEEDIRQTSDKGLKALRERMSSLQLWNAWEPNRIKITHERIYSMAFHPTTSKPIVFAGDKMGTLGIVDASQEPVKAVKQEDEEEEDEDPQITNIKPHTRTISAMHTHPSKPETLYTASYDSSIRATDLQKAVAVEVYGPTNKEDDEPVSGIDMAALDPNILYFATLNGAFGKFDMREPPSSAELYQLSEKKIGGFSLNPLAPHYVATASLDRFLRLWDLRKISKKLPTLVGEHESRLSVSHAAFNTAGQVATTSYDDTIKIHSFGVIHNVRSNSKKGTIALENMSSWKPGFQLDEDAMKPEVVVRHNNQTGRWTTILKPRWQMYPEDNIQKLVVGNMNRFVDMYAGDGTQLAQLGGEGITAVPAVAVLHPSKEWVAGGTSSGKLTLWM